MTRILVALILVFSAPTSETCVMLAPGTAFPGTSYLSYAQNFAESVVAIHYSSPYTGRVDYASGVQIDDLHVLTAAHVVDEGGLIPVANIGVRIGTDTFSPSQNIPIRRYKVHPTYVVGMDVTSTGTRLDLAIIELEFPVPGRGRPIATAMGINGRVATRSVVSCAGFGKPAIGNTGVIEEKDGLMRAFESVVDSRVLSIFAIEFYTRTRAGNAGEPPMIFPGYASSGHSGGGVFLDGQLIGIMIAAQTSISTSGSTHFLNLGHASVVSFVDEFRRSSANVPGAFRLQGLTISPPIGTNGPRTSGRIIGGEGDAVVRIEASRDLGVLDAWHTIGSYTLDRAGERELPTINDDRATVLEAKQYFVRAIMDQ